jgi:hypothetical protein
VIDAVPGGYDPRMRFMRPVLLVLSLPAGVIGYTIGAALMSAVSIPEPAHGILELFVPLFLGGLCMVPFLVPFFDAMAKRDLANRPGGEGADAADPAGKPGRRT